MPHFKAIPAKREHCSQIACLMRDDQREAIIALGLDPYRELVQGLRRNAPSDGVADQR